MKPHAKRILPVSAALVALLLLSGCHHQPDDTGPIIHAEGTPGPHMSTVSPTSAASGGPSGPVGYAPSGGPAGGPSGPAPGGYPVYRQTGGPTGGASGPAPSGGPMTGPAGPSSMSAPGSAGSVAPGRAQKQTLPAPTMN